ncbi:MAG: hypothetical protein EOM91_20170 [Sphingobacteriia bacterium]|nr:hypothetical protein [Sphingobacteriia bacterium]
MTTDYTWDDLLTDAGRALEAFEPDYIALERHTDPKEAVFDGETAWIACYPVPGTAEGFHVYVDRIPAAAKGSRAIHLTAKFWSREHAVQGAAALARLILIEEGSQ